MIYQLDQITFQNFGKVLSEDFPIFSCPNSHALSLSPQDVSTYQTNATTYFQNDTGTTVLSVSLDGVRYQDFYLTRPVQLLRGIWFRLSAFGSSASVIEAALSMPRLIQTQAADTFRIRAKSRITQISSLVYHEKERGFLFPGSATAAARLLYVDRGPLHCSADGKDYILNQGEMVVYAPDQWHMYYGDLDVAPRFVTIDFLVENWELSPLSNRVFSSNETAKTLLFQMLQEQRDDQTHTGEMLLNLLSILLIFLERLPESGEEQATIPLDSRHENEIIRRAQQYISNHIFERLNVPIIAENTGVSASYLTALFGKHLQISPGEYLRRVKLEESKQMIREGKGNFTEIAAALQYSTIHHFSRQFKEKFGVTPSEYAKSIR